MENIFYDNRELGVFLSNEEIEELKSSGKISAGEGGKTLELKVFENEKNTNPVQLNNLGKGVSEIENIELYIDKGIREKLENKGFVRDKYGINEIVIYSENYDFFDALNEFYNLK